MSPSPAPPYRDGRRRRFGVAVAVATALTLAFLLAVVLTRPGRDYGTGPVTPEAASEATSTVDLTTVENAGMHQPPTTPQGRGGGPAGQRSGGD